MVLDAQVNKLCEPQHLVLGMPKYYDRIANKLCVGYTGDLSEGAEDLLHKAG